jgi:hypothetical protein
VHQVLIVRGLLRPSECAKLLQLAGTAGWKASRVGDAVLDTAIRDSDTAWLHGRSALRDELDHRVGVLVGLPVANAESLQLVRYRPTGGFFNEHQDGSVEHHPWHN